MSKFFYHGGALPNYDISSIDVLRLSIKQQNKNNSYVGFYMYDALNYAIEFAYKENERTNTTLKGVLVLELEDDLKVVEVKPMAITRIRKEDIIELANNGYDLIKGKVLNKIEYVLINKDKVKNTMFMPINEDIKTR